MNGRGLHKNTVFICKPLHDKREERHVFNNRFTSHFVVYNTLVLYMKISLSVLLASFLVTGCGVYECIDAKIPRTPILLELTSVEINYSGATVIHKDVRCERYYDALCAERGNYWAVREVGTTSQHTISWATIQDPRIGEIKFDLPLCNYVHQGLVTTLKWVHPIINGENYSYVGSNGRIHTYRTLSKGKSKLIELEFDYKINGLSLAGTHG